MVNWELDEIQFERESQAREELVRRCMADNNYPYTPSQTRIANELPDDDPLPKDPNTAFADSLAPAARANYWLTLAGAPTSDDQTVTHVGGCLGMAHAAIPGVYRLGEELQEPLDQLRESVEYRNANDSVRRSLEDAFVAHHRALLEAHKGRIAAGEALLDTLIGPG